MTIPQDAVEAAAIIVSGDTEKWFYEYPTSDSDRAGYGGKAHKAICPPSSNRSGRKWRKRFAENATY